MSRFGLFHYDDDTPLNYYTRRRSRAEPADAVFGLIGKSHHTMVSARADARHATVTTLPARYRNAACRGDYGLVSAPARAPRHFARPVSATRR